MDKPARYDAGAAEPRWAEWWRDLGIYHFSPDAPGPIYSIDTPPPTVSGYLHLGHVYSYSQTDFMARFWRMNGYNVYYPMGYDDNGLPTERLVERRHGVTAQGVGREAFIARCLQASVEAEKEYEALWRRLGLSIDWRYSYRTIDVAARRTSQWSFIDLYRKGLAYRQEAPAIWCPECQTAIAEAELADLDRQSEFVTLAFRLDDGSTLPIATTRPELLPACVAVFVHPADERFRDLVGHQASLPLLGREAPVLADPAADPAKGTGAVMCCTFGDATDVQWWRTHHLPLIAAIGRDGRMTPAAGEWAGLPTAEARRAIVQALEERGLVLGRQPVAQSVRVHERCDTPVEYVVTRQWFVRVLDFKERILQAGESITWHPAHMQARFRDWVEGLRWDWCISRQRYFGVPFPVWTCDVCGEVALAREQDLPVDPSTQGPGAPCAKCGGASFTPERDVMDTWATSSLTPQVVGQWLAGPDLYRRVFPMSLRPQAHEIIRTWAFYTIVKSLHHWGELPWKEVAISGWGLAPEGSGKISKSRGGGPMAPLDMIARYSADAVRYWAASTSFGKDSVISEDKIQAGAKLVTKLWNVAQFARRFLEGYAPPGAHALPEALSPADRWILARLQELIGAATAHWREYNYAAAKSETEDFFWRDLADNYLEMAKLRLYEGEPDTREAACYTLYHVFLAILKLLAPVLPYIAEEIYQVMYTPAQGVGSIHTSRWPQVDPRLQDDTAAALGEKLIAIATAARRFKTEHDLPLGTRLGALCLATSDIGLAEKLAAARRDLMSITRAERVDVGAGLADAAEIVLSQAELSAAILASG